MKTYSIEYSWGDGRYVIHLPATSAAEAMERIRQAANHGRCYSPEGIDMTIPAGPGAGLLARAYVWLRNALAGRGK